MTDQTKIPAPAADKPRPKPAVASPAAGISSKLIGNVGVELHAFLGAAEMTVAELAALAPESLVTLDARLNAAVELRLNGVAVARGELVAVGEQFGVRLTEVVQWPD